MKFDGRIEATPDRPEKLEDYAELFRAIGVPPIQKDFRDDSVFAYMRVAGPNPVMLHQIAKLDDRLPVTDAMYSATIPGDTLDAAGQEGRLYLADYKMVEHVKTARSRMARSTCMRPWRCSLSTRSQSS